VSAPSTRAAIERTAALDTCDWIPTTRLTTRTRSLAGAPAIELVPRDAEREGLLTGSALMAAL